MTSSRPSAFSLTSPGRLRLYRTQELLRLPPPRWQVDSILPAGGLIGLYGPPGSGKSFIAIDLAMCVSSGLPWHEHQVEPGFVLYVSAEGGTGIGKRVQAWLASNEVAADVAKVGWLIESIPVNVDSEDMDVLIDRLDEIEEKPTLVIIDTLARCFDGDENQQEDMGRFIAGVDRLRRDFDSTVIVVHHTRLDGDRERGNTAFRGAADTMCSVERKPGGPLILKCNKQKDSEEFPDHAFILKVVPEYESCVIAGSTQSATTDITRVLTIGPLSFSDLRDRLNEQGSLRSPATFKRTLVSLLEKGEIIKENGIYSISEAHD